MDRERLVVHQTGEVFSVGVQYAGKRLVVPYPNSRGLLLVKEMAGKAWDGNGVPWTHTRATLFVYRIISSRPMKVSERVGVHGRFDADAKGRRLIVAELVLDIELANIAKVKPTGKASVTPSPGKAVRAVRSGKVGWGRGSVRMALPVNVGRLPGSDTWRGPLHPFAKAAGA